MFTYLYLVERRVVLAKVHAVRATARPLFGSFFLFAFVVYLNNHGTVGAALGADNGFSRYRVGPLSVNISAGRVEQENGLHPWGEIT